ncbi:MAG: BfmA/BtgA family mobilization protein [Balneola sp.]
MEQSTTIKFTKKQRDYISECAARAEKTMGEFAHQCVVFIGKNKYDPYDVDDFHTAEELKKLRSSIVRFIRTQETKYIIPMVQTVNGMASSQMEFSQLLQNFISQNALLEDDSDQIQGGSSEGNALSKDPYTEKANTEISRLKDILSQKDKKLHAQREALDAIKKSSLPKKGQVILNMTEEEFNRVISLL